MKPHKKFSLYTSLLNICEAHDHRDELNDIIKKSYQISISFIRTKFYNKLNFHFGELSYEDIAMDAVVPLFVKNTNGDTGIKVAYDNWNDPIKDENDAIYFLSKIIMKRVEQEITKILKTQDPVFEKILKTLKTCIKNNSLNQVRYFGTLYVLPQGNNEIIGAVISDELFNSIPINLFGNKQLALFEKIFKYISKYFEYQAAIPLNLLVNRVKFYHASDYLQNPTFSHCSENKFDVQDIVKLGLNDIKTKLDTFYVAKNKLNSYESELIYASFNDISKDMLNGGLSGGLYTYLKDRDSSISSDIFYSKYRNIMKYLMDDFKNKLGGAILED